MATTDSCNMGAVLNEGGEEEEEGNRRHKALRLEMGGVKSENHHWLDETAKASDWLQV